MLLTRLQRLQPFKAIVFPFPGKGGGNTFAPLDQQLFGQWGGTVQRELAEHGRLVGPFGAGHAAFGVVGVGGDPFDREVVSFEGVFLADAAAKAVVARIMLANGLACVVQPVLTRHFVEAIALCNLLLLANTRFVRCSHPAGDDIACFAKWRVFAVLRNAVRRGGLAQPVPGIVFKGGCQRQGLAVVVVEDGFFAHFAQFIVLAPRNQPTLPRTCSTRRAIHGVRFALFGHHPAAAIQGDEGGHARTPGDRLPGLPGSAFFRVGDQPVALDYLGLVHALAGRNGFLYQAGERVVAAANAVAGVIFFVHDLAMQARHGHAGGLLHQVEAGHGFVGPVFQAMLLVDDLAVFPFDA